jgi:agmatinase
MSEPVGPTGFDPDSAADADSGIFGLDCSEEQAALVYLPVPWEATVSYGGGTSRGPRAILEASRQIDLFDLEVLRPYQPGLHMLEESSRIRQLGSSARADAKRVIAAAGQVAGDAALEASLARVNQLGAELNERVQSTTGRLLDDGKIVGVVGGDHSVPFGALRALAERKPCFGVLHIDAHSDTRAAYQGFTWSHASIMYNVLEQIPQVTRLVQVGIRDFCGQELEYCERQGERVETFFDGHLARRGFEAEPWAKVAGEIVATLPQEVWVSFDIDGLDPRLCPHTGTPVPGGLDFEQASYLLGALVRSGRRILGFDLCEVAPPPAGPEAENEWDANVGARLLYRLSAWTLASQKRCPLR